MENRNCPNCGAPIDIDKNKCAYCGTSNFDLSCIPLFEPFYLRLNLGTKENPRIITQKVYTAGATITNNMEYSIREDSYDGRICPIRVPGFNAYELTFIGINEVK